MQYTYHCNFFSMSLCSSFDQHQHAVSDLNQNYDSKKVKVKAFLYSIASVGPGADTGVQAVSPQVTVSHPLGGKLSLLSARPSVTSPATEHHRPLAGTKLYCLVTEAHRCEQLAQRSYAALPRVGFEPATYWSQVQGSTRCTTAPHNYDSMIIKICFGGNSDN